MKTKELITDCNSYAEDACSYVVDVLIRMLRYEYRSSDLMISEVSAFIVEEDIQRHISKGCNNAD